MGDTSRHRDGKPSGNAGECMLSLRTYATAPIGRCISSAPCRKRMPDRLTTFTTRLTTLTLHEACHTIARHRRAYRHHIYDIAGRAAICRRIPRRPAQPKQTHSNRRSGTEGRTQSTRRKVRRVVGRGRQRNNSCRIDVAEFTPHGRALTERGRTACLSTNNMSHATPTRSDSSNHRRRPA